ncbi:endoplasmic oxidoreductin-1 [[Candida] anglica]|uniref:Endoplasmic oxidoreductin-1 n=1 Tax=[Candida] anglica TaxID=148631 RepID=A0ABP0EBT6_9ASCO
MYIYVPFVLLITTVFATINGGSGGNGGNFMSPINQFSPFDSQDFCSQIITPTCNTTFSYIDSLNANIRPHIQKLVSTPYFRHFKLNFEKQCQFWNAQHFCATRNCAVEVLPSDQYNWSNLSNFESLNPSKLGEIEFQEDADAGTCEDLDYCHIDDDHQCVYVDLLENPERFTGYGGTQSFDVWKAIYSENCFPNTNPMSMKSSDEPEQCVEKNLFYRLISGLHASIAVHLSNEYLSPDSEVFEPNLKVFMERVGAYNERLSNIYFNYALISQSIIKLSEIFSGALADHITCGDDEILDKSSSQQKLLGNDEPDYKEVFGSIIPTLSSHTLFNTSTLFDPKVVSPELKNEFRARFKNVSAIMDCVGCDRCRMWGKLQTIGYGTALKILFETDNKPVKFKRIELVALFNTFDRISKSVEAINGFKELYTKHLEDVKLGLAQPGDYETLKQKEGFNFPFKAPKKEFQPEIPKETTEKAKKDTSSKKEESKSTIENLRKKPNRTFSEEFQVAFDDVLDAFYFVIGSYRSFPITCFNIAMVKLNHYWNKFVGIKGTTFYEQIMLEQQKESQDNDAYEKLFVN